MASLRQQATRAAPFALRVVQRRQGLAAIVYRRRLNDKMEERFDKVAALSPLALTAGSGLLRAAVRLSMGGGRLQPGPFVPLDEDWGARVAGFALVAKGLRNPRRLSRAAEYWRAADATEAAFWFGRMQDGRATRWLRAARVITEAVR
jgi:hypothetical protein